MPKRTRTQRRKEEEKQGSQASSETRSNSRQDRERVNSRIKSLVYNEECLRIYKEKFENRKILSTKFINLTELARLYQEHNVHTANSLATQGWIDFTKVNRPICKFLLRILIANLDENTMMSRIGKKKVDLSEAAWCRTFNIPAVTEEEEESIMRLEKEEVFYRLSGTHNLGNKSFIKIHHLHQEATMRLSAQIVNTILIPKKGAKEQIKFEESRLLYALMYCKKINLAKMIVNKLRAVLRRKSSPITYGMHLMTLMEKAGVDLRCTEEEEKTNSAPIDHHTLKRMGFKLHQGTWDFVGKGQVNASFPTQGKGKRKEKKVEGGKEDTQAATEDHSQTKSSAPFQPTFQCLQSDIPHLRSFLMEQLHLMQASILSKLDSLDSRVQKLEEFLLFQPPSSPNHSPPIDPTDPKGKRPLSPIASFHTPPTSPSSEPSEKPPSPPPESSKPPSPIHEPQPSPPSSPKPLSPSSASQPQPSPILIDTTSSHSTSNSTSSSTAADSYVVAARPISTRLRSRKRATTSTISRALPPP